MNNSVFTVTCDPLESTEYQNYAEAAISLNPTISWIKFTFTDDTPNANKMRIPKDEFQNIIKTGSHMPIKMEYLNPNGSHELSAPLGVITNLVQQDNKIIGLGALWTEERPNDVKILLDKFNNGEPLNLSWEVFYEEAIEDENGIKDLKGTVVRAITFVGSPAYEGRTNVFAMAQKEATLEELNQLKQQVADLEDKIKELTEQLVAKENELNTKAQEMSDIIKERDNLLAWKAEQEAEKARQEILNQRKNKLLEIGISEEEFATREERILSMDDETFEFYAQDLAAFSKSKNSVNSEHAENSSIPDISSETSKDLYQILKEAFTKEN